MFSTRDHFTWESNWSSTSEEVTMKQCISETNDLLVQFLEEKFVVKLQKLFFCTFTFPKVTIDNDLLCSLSSEFKDKGCSIITKYKRQCAELYLPWLLSDSWKDRQNWNLNLCRAAFAIIAMILCHCLCLCSLFHFQKIWVWARCLPADDAFDLWANSGTGTSTWSGTGSRKRLFMVGHHRIRK